MDFLRNGNWFTYYMNLSIATRTIIWEKNTHLLCRVCDRSFYKYLFLTLSSLNLPLSSSSTASRELLSQFWLVVDEDDLMWVKN